MGGGKVLPLCRGAVGVFYSPSWLGNTYCEHAMYVMMIYIIIIYKKQGIHSLLSGAADAVCLAWHIIATWTLSYRDKWKKKKKNFFKSERINREKIFFKHGHIKYYFTHAYSLIKYLGWVKSFAIFWLQFSSSWYFCQGQWRWWSHSGLWDAELTWYSLSATNRICLWFGV